MVIQPRECATVPIVVTRPNRNGADGDCVMEPKCVNHQAVIARALITDDRNHACLRFLNPTNDAVALSRFHCLGTAEAINSYCGQRGITSLCQPSLSAEGNAATDDGVRAVMQINSKRERN